MFKHWLPLLLTLLYALGVGAWIDYASDGSATMTHYTLPEGFVAACGCVGDSTKYPTAAMSQMAYGSATSYGPACGRCFNLTLLNTYAAFPPFFPTVSKSVVVKVTDLCPFGGSWCNATATKPNKGGQFINFDLVWPSPAIPNDFFPSNASLYGFTDFGVWNVSYESVACSEWAGWKHEDAIGSDPSLGSSGCCPADPFTNSSQVCPSFSDANGIPPDTTAKSAAAPQLIATSFTLGFVSCLLLISGLLTLGWS